MSPVTAAGWKYHHWELKGVPVRVELGPRDVDKVAPAATWSNLAPSVAPGVT